MAGIGALAFLGGLSGAGKGLADVGQNMHQEALLEARSRAAAEAEQRRAALQQDLLERRLAAQDAMLDKRLAAKGGGGGDGSGGGGGGSASAAELARNPGLLALYSGEDRAVIDAAMAMAEGRAPTRTEPLDPNRFSNPDRIDEAQGQTVDVPAYSPGQAAQIRERARNAFREALKVTNPGQSDDVAKSQQTDLITGALSAFRKGDTRAGETAALGIKGEVYDASGNKVTGATGPAGSVSATAAAENQASAREKDAGATHHRASAGAQGALARKYDAEANNERGKADPSNPSTVKEQLQAIDAARKQLAVDLAAVKAEEASLNSIDSPLSKKEKAPMLAALAERRRQLQTRSDELEGLTKDLINRTSGKKSAGGGRGAVNPPAAAPGPMPPGVPAPKSQADYAKLPQGTRYRAPDGSIRVKP